MASTVKRVCNHVLYVLCVHVTILSCVVLVRLGHDCVRTPTKTRFHAVYSISCKERQQASNSKPQYPTTKGFPFTCTFSSETVSYLTTVCGIIRPGQVDCKGAEVHCMHCIRCMHVVDLLPSHTASPFIFNCTSVLKSGRLIVSCSGSKPVTTHVCRVDHGSPQFCKS